MEADQHPQSSPIKSQSSQEVKSTQVAESVSVPKNFRGSWDVSDSKYAEGISQVRLVVPMMAKVMTNVVGAVLASGGYTLAKVTSAVSEEEIADSEAFQWGLTNWLYMNGIFPEIDYMPLGDSTLRLHEFYSPEKPLCQKTQVDDMRTTPLLVCNHMCYLDGCLMTACLGMPKIIAMKGTLNVPLIGTMGRDIGIVEVDRSDKASRSATIDFIANHVAEWKTGDRPLLLFPEGTCTNGESILPFKKGAFMCGVPVRPMVLLYTGEWNPANVNCKMGSNGEIEATGDLEWCEHFLGNFLHSLRVKVLPPYIPSEAERANNELYAANVRDVMLEAHQTLKKQVEKEGQGSVHAFVDALSDYLDPQCWFSALEADMENDKAPELFVEKFY